MSEMQPEHPEVRALLDEAARLGAVDADAAECLALDARVRARVEGSAVAEAEAVHQLASIKLSRGDTFEAFALASEAIALVVDLEPHPVHAWSLHLIGVVHYRAGNHAFALDASRRALDVYRSTIDQVNEGRFLATIAAVHQSMGDYDLAIDTYDAALIVNNLHGRSDLAAVVLGNLARLRGRRGEHLTAIAIGRDAIELAREHAPHLVAGLYADVAEASAELGEPETALRCFTDARSDWACRAADGAEVTVKEQLSVMISEGRVALRGDHVDAAIASLTEALELADLHEHRRSQLEIHDHLATAFKKVGRDGEALRHRELQFSLHRDVTADATELRMRTLQIAHDGESARLGAEMTRLRTSALSTDFVDSLAEVDAFHVEAFERLASIAELRGGNTTRHTDAVGDLAAEIAHAIGQPSEWCDRLRLAARLHDIGKVAVLDTVLRKPGPLDVEEFDAVKQHTVIGRRILSGVSTPLFELAAECAWSHHEWWDGSGYPNGLAVEDIPLSGRIVAIADVFDALATRRLYKREWGLREAMRHVESGAGTQFDPRLVAAFVSVMSAQHPELTSDA
jgi:putative two-component system response regulator